MCGKCSDCGYCFNADGTGECVSGNKNGPLYRTCANYEYTKPNHHINTDPYNYYYSHGSNHSLYYPYNHNNGQWSDNYGIRHFNKNSSHHDGGHYRRNIGQYERNEHSGRGGTGGQYERNKHSGRYERGRNSSRSGSRSSDRGGRHK